MRSHITKVFHLAEASNLPSILEHGLMSTKRLFGLTLVPEADQAGRLRSHRPDNERLSDSVLIRDQKPMPPSALERALEDGLTPPIGMRFSTTLSSSGSIRAGWSASAVHAVIARKSC